MLVRRQESSGLPVRYHGSRRWAAGCSGVATKPKGCCRPHTRSQKSLNKIITIGEFQREFRRVYDRSKKDVCRYYVGLFNQAKSGDKSTANRSAVENYFYVYLRPK